MMDGYPHDYGERCCCETCTGPDGDLCRPDDWQGNCGRCGRKAVRDSREITAQLLETIADNLPVAGQTSWLE